MRTSTAAPWALAAKPGPFFPLSLFFAGGVQGAAVDGRMTVHAECNEVHRVTSTANGTRVQVVDL